jgi:hypothetical protein
MISRVDLSILFTIIGVIFTIYAIYLQRKAKNITIEKVKKIITEKPKLVLPEIGKDEKLLNLIISDLKSLKVGKITIYQNREKAMSGMADIAGHAKNGDILFGACRKCEGHTPEFFKNLFKGLRTDVKIKILLNKTSASKEFEEKMNVFDKNKVDIRKTDHMFARFFGIKGGEIKLVIPNDEKYFCIHFRDKIISDFLWDSFIPIFNKSSKVGELQEEE